MKIDFEDKSSVEITKTTDNCINLIIKAKDNNNLLKKIVNSVKITKEQLEYLLSDIKD